MSLQFRTWLRKKGICHRIANVQVPQEIAVAERKGGILQTVMNSMLIDVGCLEFIGLKQFNVLVTF